MKKQFHQIVYKYVVNVANAERSIEICEFQHKNDEEEVDLHTKLVDRYTCTYIY